MNGIPIHYIRRFPRYFGPKHLMGPHVPSYHSEEAQQSFKIWNKTKKFSQELETAMFKDHDIAFLYICNGGLNKENQELAENTFVKCPLLISKFTRKFKWVDLDKCTKNVKVDPEIAWEFHYLNPKSNPNLNVEIFKKDPHYCWRALDTLKFNFNEEQELKNTLKTSTLYGSMLEPKGNKRTKFIEDRKDTTEGQLTKLLWETYKTKNTIHKYELIGEIKDAIKLSTLTTYESNEIISLIALAPGNQNLEENTITSDDIAELLKKEPRWIYHIAKNSPNKILGDEYSKILSKMTTAYGWLLQLYYESPEKNFDEVYQFVLQYLDTANTKEDLIKLNKWRMDCLIQQKSN